MKGLLQARILEALEKDLHPAAMTVENTSDSHASHQEVRGGGGETHFSVRVQSDAFRGMVGGSRNLRTLWTDTGSCTSRWDSHSTRACMQWRLTATLTSRIKRVALVNLVHFGNRLAFAA